MIRCIPMADNGTPAASPTTSNSPVSRKIIAITALCCAPRALRMPISLCAAPLHTKGLHRGLGPGIFFTGARYESPRPMNSVRSGNVFYNTPSRRAVKRHCQTLRRQQDLGDVRNGRCTAKCGDAFPERRLGTVGIVRPKVATEHPTIWGYPGNPPQHTLFVRNPKHQAGIFATALERFGKKAVRR